MSLFPANNTHKSRAFLLIFPIRIKDILLTSKRQRESVKITVCLWRVQWCTYCGYHHLISLQSSTSCKKKSDNPKFYWDFHFMPLCHAWTAPGTNATIFLVKHKGPTAKEGLGLSNNWFFSSAAKPNSWKRMLVQTEPNSQFSRFPHQNHYHPHPAHCTLFNMKCSMCLKRKHFWKMQTFGKCKHKRQGNTIQDLQNCCRGIVLSFYIQFTLCYTKTLSYCIEATASRVPLTSG